MKSTTPENRSPQNGERVIALTYDDITHLMDKVYNEPTYTDDFTRDDFLGEYKAIYKDVLQGLQAFGTFASIGSSDFSMGPPWSNSRKVGVCFDSAKMATPQVLDLLKALLQRHEQSYVITIDGAHIEGQHAYICIQKDGPILGYADDPAWLKPFGF